MPPAALPQAPAPEKGKVAFNFVFWPHCMPVLVLHALMMMIKTTIHNTTYNWLCEGAQLVRASSLCYTSS